MKFVHFSIDTLIKGEITIIEYGGRIYFVEKTKTEKWFLCQAVPYYSAAGSEYGYGNYFQRYQYPVEAKSAEEALYVADRKYGIQADDEFEE